MIRFGPSGNSQSFYDAGYKSSLQMPGWLRQKGLSAYEYQCSKGVKIGNEMAVKLGEEALKHDIFLSIHAPYYINLASQEEDKQDNSIRYIIETLEAARWMNASRIVVHTGSCSKIDRQLALDTAIENLKRAICEADALGLGHITICPEVLGKVNQLGDLDEILKMCSIDERLIPTVDFGHIHARGLGALNTKLDFQNVLDRIENEIGNERMRKIHIHFSRIEYTKGGEKRHWSLDDVQYGPEFHPLAQLMYERDMEPVIICESREKMAEDAIKLQEIYMAEAREV
ncbi:TIM barrel protein [Pseudobacteroides cellulosolvens]|uniref:Xylose isomerase domain-containing protein TIM barrel n=1 Tax=Pseudobacteroides cellulosolvens ATCC 35603 = DSM 2933 TaxID=398512 RepID=A0A0L6JMV4_9FIRM|nr:TIM barrel protein [Pseudobacteroides cellulosolvens]KNY26702.1 Xylose isomerase domain-containing protein TIM barrel [Pseudobacteroides cellulosolvens ATCC 35603 = DSM 2933]